MARKVKSSESTGSSKKIRPALTPEARELQMISLAVDLAERQLLEGTASSQVITHYLKLGSSREAEFDLYACRIVERGEVDGRGAGACHSKGRDCLWSKIAGTKTMS